jgi:hypothetical protein
MIYYIILLFIIFILYSLIYLREIKYNEYNTSLDKDGFIIFNNINNEDVLKYLPENYQILNYSYTIKGCTLSTFHRDVTSSQYILNSKHPIYTYIVYKNKGYNPLLSVCPKSHKTIPFTYSKPINIYGNYNTSVLFNSDLLHAGALNNLKNSRYAKQYKIVHKDDLEILSKLDNVHTEKIGNCNISDNYEYVSRKISLLFPYFFNHVLTSYLQEKQDNILGVILEKIYGQNFYNKY